MSRLFFVLVLATALSGTALAQPTADAFQIKSIEVRREPLPNSEKPWIKLIANYTSAAKWADGLSFVYTAIVRPQSEGPEQKPRILTGAATYVNVPAGDHQAITYLSPGAVARFGEPVAVKVECFKGDEQIGSMVWTASGGSPADLANTDLRRLDGFLRGVQSTPWLLIDGDRTPDLFIPY